MRSWTLLLVASAFVAACQLPGPPVAIDDVAVAARGTVDLDVVANDYSYTGDPRIELTSMPDCGTASATEGIVRYRSDPTCPASISFRYRISDDGGTSNEAEIRLELGITSDDVEVITAADVAVEVPLDISGTEAVALARLPANGTVETGPGVAVYLPAPGFAGVDEFELVIGDGSRRAFVRAVVLRLVAEPSPVVLPPAALGAESRTEVAVTNTGGGPVPADLVPPEPPFAIFGSSCGDLIEVGSTCALEIGFAGEVAGEHVGVVTFRYGGGGLEVPVLALAGEAVVVFESPQMIRIRDRDVLDLGATRPGLEGERVPIVLFNQSEFPADVARVTAEPSQPFAVDTGCIGILAPGRRCEGSVWLTGSTAATTTTVVSRATPVFEQRAVVSGVLVAAGPDGAPLAGVVIEGLLAPPAVEVRVFPDGVETDSVEAVDFRESAEIVIRTTSEVAVRIELVEILPDPGSEGVYEFADGDCPMEIDPVQPITLELGQECVVTVVADTGSGEGEFGATLLIRADAPTPPIRFTRFVLR